ncbi:MAG: MarR family winged helix-turn-helix transcriptional regulator [Gaiellaceae bacterium]
MPEMRDETSAGALAEELARVWLDVGRRMWSRKLSGSLHPKLAALSPGKLQALMLLGESSEPRIGDLASRLGLDESTVTRLVDRLELLGLAARRPSQSDRRATVVVLTDDGQEALATLQTQRRRLFAEMLEALDADERREFLRLTAKVAQGLQASRESAR